MEEILKENGWTVVCESPLEIQHEDGSVATGLGAQIVLYHYEDQSPKDGGSDNVDVVLDEDDIESIEQLINGNGGNEKDAVYEFLQGRFRDYFEMDEWDNPETYKLIFDYKGNKYRLEIEEDGCCEVTSEHRIMFWTGTLTKLK